MSDRIPTPRAPASLVRPNVPALDALLGVPWPCLDHGFVRLIDYMGDEAAIVQAARVSYGAGTKTVRADAGLIRYLMRHRHTTPLEMCEIKLHCKMPLFVARQWIRHRTASVNEYSGRYSILAQEFYVPEPADLGTQSAKNRQGRAAGDLTPQQARDALAVINDVSTRSYTAYEQLLNDHGDGTPADPDLPMIARELARMNLTLNYYTEWYWKIDLHNLLHFLSLRMDPHAQMEMRTYADSVGQIAQLWVPTVWAAFNDYHPNRGAHTFSAMEMQILQNLVKHWAPSGILDKIPYLELGISKREWGAFRHVLAMDQTEED